jgi:hypothetical protein
MNNNIQEDTNEDTFNSYLLNYCTMDCKDTCFCKKDDINNKNFKTMIKNAQFNIELESLEKDVFKYVIRPNYRFFVEIPYEYPFKTSAYIRTLAVNKKLNKSPVVLLHGYLGAIGDWRHCIDFLSESRSLFAIDLLGFGRSSRVEFSKDSIIAELQFVDSIEEWRKQMKLEKMILIGHSFGAYIWFEFR